MMVLVLCGGEGERTGDLVVFRVCGLWLAEKSDGSA